MSARSSPAEEAEEWAVYFVFLSERLCTVYASMEMKEVEAFFSFSFVERLYVLLTSKGDKENLPHPPHPVQQLKFTYPVKQDSLGSGCIVLA